MRWLTAWVLLAVAFPAAAQSQDQPTVTAYLRDTARVESWSFFQPVPGQGTGDPDYTLFGNRATLGVRVESQRVGVDGAFQYSQLVRLPARAIGPGALGSGGFYYYSAEATEAYQLYIKRMVLRLKNVLPGTSIALGRMEFSSSEESPSREPAIANLKRFRLGARLIGDFEWSIFQRAFDGARVDIVRPAWAANASLLFPTQGGYEESANPTISTVKVIASSLSLMPSWLPHQETQLFAYHYRDRRGVRARPDNSGRVPRPIDVSIATIGASHVATLPISGGRADVVAWAAVQTGDWYGQDHRAVSATGEAGYRFDAPWRPWLRGGYLYASGDRNGADARHNTFFQMLPSIHRYSLSTVYSQMNLRDAFAQLLVEPAARVTARAEVHRLSLAAAADRWYYGSGATSRTGTFFGFSSRPSLGANRLGTVVEGTADVSLRKAWSVNAYLGFIKGGEVVRRQFLRDRLVMFYAENVFSF